MGVRQLVVAVASIVALAAGSVVAAQPPARPPAQPPRPRAADSLPPRDSIARDSLGRDSLAADSLAADSLERELVEWAPADSVMQALLQRSGYAVTRYQGAEAVFYAGERRIDLTGEPAAVQQGEAVIVGNTIIYNDSTGIVIVRRGAGPRVTLRDPAQGEDVVADTIRYDIRRSQGTVTGVSTSVESGERWYVSADRAGIVGAQPGDSAALRFYGHDGSITSCDLTEPHYHFEARNLKVIRGSIMVARPAVLYVGNVPVMWLPFVFQDMRTGRRSGLLSPRFGVAELVRNSPTYRRSVSNIGYYFAISDYMDASLWLDWRSGARSTDFDPGFLQYNGEMQYNVLSRFLSGRVGVGYEAWRDGRRNLTLTWGHRQQFSQATSFTTDINYAQNTQLQRLGAFVPAAALATIRSNGSLQHARGPFRFSLGGDAKQYTGRDQVDISFPSLTVNSEPISLGEWLTWTPSLDARSAMNLNNPVLGDLGIRYNVDPVTGIAVPDSLNRLQYDRRNTTLSMQTPLKIFNFNLQNTVRFSDQESDAPVRATVYGLGAAGDSSQRVFARSFQSEVDWTTSFGLPQLFGGTWNVSPSVGFQNVDSRAFMVRSQLSGGAWVSQTKRPSYSLSAAPTLYRLLPGIGPFAAFRHGVSPSVSYNYAPAATVPREFLRAVGQNPRTYVGALMQSALSLSLSTVFEGKLRSATDTAPGAGEKIKLLALDFTPLSYDFIRADTLGRGFTNETFSYSARSDLLPGLNLNVIYSLFNGPSADRDSEFKPYRTNISGSFSFGQTDNPLALLSRIFGRAIPVERPGLGAPTPSDSAAFEYAQRPIAGSDSRVPVQEIPSGQGWRGSVSFTSTRSRPDQRGNVVDYDPGLACEALRGDQINFDECVRLQELNPPDPDVFPTAGNQIVRFPSQTSVTSSMTFDLTPKWSGSWNSSYDFQRSEFASQSFTLQRDLHDWRASFSVNHAPNGNFAFSFFIALKAQEDLKFDFDRRSYRGQSQFDQ